MSSFSKYLQGGDLRSIANVEQLIPLIQSQADFDKLFQYLFSNDRLLVMRAVDAIEKITSDKPEFLQNHEKELLDFLTLAQDKEFKWHIAQLVPRLKLSNTDLKQVWSKLKVWTTDKSESRIVRVNSLQALNDLIANDKDLKKDFESILQQVEKENIPSINARIRKFRRNNNSN